MAASCSALAKAAADYMPQNERRVWADKILALIERDLAPRA